MDVWFQKAVCYFCCFVPTSLPCIFIVTSVHPSMPSFCMDLHDMKAVSLILSCFFFFFCVFFFNLDIIDIKSYICFRGGTSWFSSCTLCRMITMISLLNFRYATWLQYFCVMRTFKMYPLSNFQIHSTGLLTIVPVLYIASPWFIL